MARGQAFHSTQANAWSFWVPHSRRRRGCGCRLTPATPLRWNSYLGSRSDRPHTRARSIRRLENLCRSWLQRRPTNNKKDGAKRLPFAEPFPRVFELLAPGLARSAPARPPPLSLHVRHLNDRVIVSRALISSPQGGYMVHAARASASRAATPPSPNQSLVFVAL